MSKKYFVVIAIIVAGAAAIYAWNPFWNSNPGFAEYAIPVQATQDLMDIGIVDANGDDLLDIFTSNHNYRQNLLLANKKGSYEDVITEWGLDQSSEFPGIELATTDPATDKAGVYIFWKERRKLIIRVQMNNDLGPVKGMLRSYTQVKRFDAGGFKVDLQAPPVGSQDQMQESVLRFASERSGTLEMEMVSPGVPITVELEESTPLNRVYVGSQKKSPQSHHFELALQDRHGLAWADYNDDGKLDLFITRGAMGGTLAKYPTVVSNKIKDEFFVSQSGNGYLNQVSQLGFAKNNCSARQAKWVDFDGDGRLDLFINCQDRGHVAGKYPKQLYRQNPDGTFTEVAAQVGLDLPDHEVVDFVWLDADNDGDMDLLTSEETGFYLYRNQGGRFVREFIGRGKFARADNPNLRGISDEYWFVDGKLTVADFNLDGYLDVFSSSKKGNELLINKGGIFSITDPSKIGLPTESVTAGWVDYDSDGLPDLYTVPDGLFKQRSDHTFQATGVLKFPPRKYMASIVNWADLDNDGSRDLLIALLDNFSFWSWWEKLWKSSEDRFKWKIVAYKNKAIGNNHWLQIRLVGRPGNRQAIGARVSVRTKSGSQVQEVGNTDGAFFSQGHYRLYFGLGSNAQIDEIEIRWPGGQPQVLTDVKADRLMVIDQRGTP